MWTAIKIIVHEIWGRSIVEPVVGPPFPAKWPSDKPRDERHDAPA
jgi:hypothetical protein